MEQQDILLEIKRLNALDTLKTTFISKAHPIYDEQVAKRDALLNGTYFNDYPDLTPEVREEVTDMYLKRQKADYGDLIKPYPTDILVLWSIEDSPLQLQYTGDGATATFSHNGKWVYSYGPNDETILETTKDLVKPFLDEVMAGFKDVELQSQTITYENADILITDPCYVLDFDWHGYGELITPTPGLKDYAHTFTASGDGGWSIDDPDGKSLGVCGADAGAMGVYDFNNLLEVYPENEMIQSFATSDKYDHVGTIFKNFTGTVTIYDKPLSAPWWGRGHVPAIKAEGSVNFEVELY